MPKRVAQATHQRQKARYRRRTGSGSYSPRAWTKGDEALVLAHDVPDRELAVKLGRSVQAVQVRRCLLRQRAVEGWSP